MSAIVWSPGRVGLMKPSKSEPIPTWRYEPVSDLIRSMWRASASTESESERGPGRPSPSRIWWLAKIRPITPSRAAIRLTVSSRQVVLLAPESAAGVRAEDRNRALGVDLVEQREGVRERAIAHVRDIDQDALVHERPQRRPAELGQALPGLREQEPVDPVGDEWDRRCVRGDAPEEQVRERHVGHAAAAQLGHGALDLGAGPAEVEAALDRVDEHDLAGVEQPVELPRTVGDGRRARVMLRQVLLHELQLAYERGRVLRLRWRAVGLAEVHLVEGRVQHRVHEPHLAGLERGEGHARERVRRRVVGEPAEQPDDRRPATGRCGVAACAPGPSSSTVDGWSSGARCMA